jgi:hypothetical protein
MTIDVCDVDDYLVRLFTDQHNRFSRDSEFVITDIVATAAAAEEQEPDSTGERTDLNSV